MYYSEPTASISDFQQDRQNIYDNERHSYSAYYDDYDNSFDFREDPYEKSNDDSVYEGQDSSYQLFTKIKPVVLKDRYDNAYITVDE